METPHAIEVLSFEEAKSIYMEAAQVFQPRTPITLQELFAGRWDQLTTVVDAVSQRGLHVAIYGERGVGKTSLANVVRPTIAAFDKQQSGAASPITRLVMRANANHGDNFSSIWKKLFQDITWQDNRPAVGLVPDQKRPPKSFMEAFGIGNAPEVDEVRRALCMLPNSVFIIDEFDRASADASRRFTDLIKVLSDHAINTTVIIVGVSDTVDRLIADHTSISRALVQILLPRMEPHELRQILDNAEKSLSVSFTDAAKLLIVSVSQGLPHYTHLIGLHAVRKSVYDRYSRVVERSDVFEALKEAVRQAEQSVREKYSRATHSAHKDALYRQVLLASAVAAATSHDSLGYFNPASLVPSLESILNRNVQIAAYNGHLAEFCKENRGSVLERTGQPRSYRYRFRDPLVVPFVFMDAIATGLITDESLAGLLGETF